MRQIIIGIQGDKGSTNERACKLFVEKMNIAPENVIIKYLITSKNVLHAVLNKEVDYGVFAVFSSRQGSVKETEVAIAELSEKQKEQYSVIDAVQLQLDHAILQKKDSILERAQPLYIYSHSQALLEHESFLYKKFSDFSSVNLISEIDTALSAEKLSNNKYPKNSLAIAPLICGELYNVDILLKDIPTNEGYNTLFHLIESN